MKIQNCTPWVRTGVLAVAVLINLLCAESRLEAQAYFYDGAGALIRVVYPDGAGISYAYDAAGNLTNLTTLSLPVAPSDLAITRPSPTSARLSWNDRSGNETGFLIMRRRYGSTTWQSIATVATNVAVFTDNSLVASEEYVYRIAANGTNGQSAYSNEFASPTDSSRAFALSGGGTSALATAGSGSTVRAGYAKVDADAGGTPYATSVFRVVENGVVVSEAGVPASPPTTSARILIDYRNRVTSPANQFQGVLNINTGFGIVNAGASTANVTYTLRDVTGRTLAVGNGTLAAGAHVSKFIHELRDIAPDFNLPVGFPESIGYGSLEFSSSRPLSIVALRLTVNQRGETLLTSTPTADLKSALSGGPLYFPQLADGGGFTTSIILMNTSSRVESGVIQLYGDNGAPFNVQQVGGGSGSSFGYSIPPLGVFIFETNGTGSAFNVGWARVTPSVQSDTPVGLGVFRFVKAGIVVTESGIPSAFPTTRARLYIDTSSGHDTGVAISNPSNTPLTLTLQGFQTDGTTPAGTGAPLQLSVNGHKAQFAGEMITGLPANFRGVLEIASAVPFAALTLRSLTNSREDFLLTTFPIADLTSLPPSPIIFPQIADGGGYSTEFILIAPGGQAQGAIRFFGDSGARLSVSGQ